MKRVSIAIASMLVLVGVIFVSAHQAALAYQPYDDPIPSGIVITGNVEQCMPTMREAFLQLQTVYMQVATTFNYQTRQWNTVVMSDAQWVDNLTNSINCDYPTDPNNGWMYVDPKAPKVIHVSYASYTSDNGYTHENHIKDFASALTHETRHEEQMKAYGFFFKYVNRQLIEWEGMQVEGGVKKALGWTNNDTVQGSYEQFLHYRYSCSVYPGQVMPMATQVRLGFVEHLYTNTTLINCNAGDYKDPSL